MWQWLRGLLSKPTKLSVAQELQRHIAARGGTEIVYDDALGEVRFSIRGGVITVTVGNVYVDMLNASRAKRKAIVARFIDSLFVQPQDELPARYDEARARILPIVRTLADDATASLMTARSISLSPSARSPKVAAKPFAGEFIAALAWDTPHSLQRITQAKLDDWGVSFEDAMDNALENLRGLPDHGGWRDQGNGVWSGEWADSYESSRVLLPDLIHRLGVPEPVALMPLRSTLLISSARNEYALAAMAALAKKLITDHSRWLSVKPIVLTDSGWQPFVPPESCASAFEELGKLDLAETYGGQQSLIEDLLKNSGAETFVGKFTLLRRNDDAKLLSYAVWTEGVDTLLPQTDLVIFVAANRKEDDSLVSVDWDAVQSVAGNLMQPTEYFPPRYRLQSFPQGEQWQRLLELARASKE